MEPSLPDSARHRRTLWTLILTFFVSSTGFSIMLPTLTFFLRDLAPAFDDQRFHLWLGMCVSANAIGQGLASPLAGMWMRQRGHFEPLVCSLLLEQVGALVFFFAHPLSAVVADWSGLASSDVSGAVLILCARFLIGVADSNLTICRVLLIQLAPIPEASSAEPAEPALAASSDASSRPSEEMVPIEDGKETSKRFISIDSAQQSNERIAAAKALRTKYISFESAARSMGLIMGTLLSSAFAPFDFHISDFRINAFNSPGMVAFLLAAVNLGLIVAFLRPAAAESSAEPMSVNAPLLDSKRSSSTATGGRVVSYGSAPTYRDSSASATEDTSAAAAAAAAAIASLPPPDSLPLYACLFVYFVNVSAFSLFETIASPFLSDMFDWSVGRVSVYFLCCTVQMLLMFLFVVPRVQRKFGLRPSLAIGLSLTAVGLSVMPRWWDVADQDFLLQYSGGTFFFLLGYPIAQVIIMQIYAGLLRPELQPVYISFIVIAGCTSRVAGPLWATTLYSQDKLGRGVYLSCAGLCVLAVATVAAVWSRLVSYTIAAALDSYDASVTHQPANANAPAPVPILKAGGNSDGAEYQALSGDAAEGARPKSGNMSSAFAAKPKSVTFDPELPEPDNDQMHANSYRAVVGLSISREIDNV